jgi:hypothetical protein
MNAALWAVQGSLAVAFPAAGEMKVSAKGKFTPMSEKRECAQNI